MSKLKPHKKALIDKIIIIYHFYDGYIVLWQNMIFGQCSVTKMVQFLLFAFGKNWCNIHVL